VSDGTITMEAAEGKAHDVETMRQLVTTPRFQAASNDFFGMGSMSAAPSMGGMR
jgi:hypothetical protein